MPEMKSLMFVIECDFFYMRLVEIVRLISHVRVTEMRVCDILDINNPQGFMGVTSRKLGPEISSAHLLPWGGGWSRSRYRDWVRLRC
jgi:hypothetical protein